MVLQFLQTYFGHRQVIIDQIVSRMHSNIESEHGVTNLWDGMWQMEYKVMNASM